MKKRSILIAILCVLSCFALMFTACESDENTGGTTQGEATQIATTATNEATAEATEVVTATATEEVTAEATNEVTEEATEEATGEATENATEIATAEATAENATPKPTAVATKAPTVKPTATATPKPTTVPTKAPTSKPTATPKPTAKPTKAPTAKPTATAVPTKAPTAKPTAVPTEPTGETYTRDGDYIYFGTYPQTEVTNSSLKSTLNGLAGTLPSSSDSQSWTSYNYYIDIESSNATDFMWYKDISHGGEKYRGVYFTSYRPYFTSYSSSSDVSYQDDNGYNTGTVYWFKYESIKWRILTENGGKAFLLCEMLIDSQAYQNCYTYQNSDYYATDDNGNILTDGANKVYANNYEYSTIRAWLNDDFYNTAFNSLQKQIIQLTTVDNSVASTGYSSDQYACENTQDKVFLLSYEEFDEYITSSAEGQKKTTAYAQCQGAWTSASGDNSGNGLWWLRSPGYNYSGYARVVNFGGHAILDGVFNARYVVSPALWITL